ncbi:MAG TPA: DUF6129 family protein [Candidatus Competibacteraceae bacterium]|nr:MAG: hypothetical protein EKK71_10315 [Candidatus Competibacteraceae bacterium]HOB62378.1 DUF6129 family protein [Candidatus Competibacteraceae bacterium]HQA27004.1 DUF6129 family protein [Candidatus Competibacteraceae bacterium]HQD56308.1 DUF6129 family protein [Candidatus Competibacteraceae bacterium]
MITPRQLSDIAQWAETQGVDYASLSRLRQVYPSLYFTQCLDDDINNVEPVLRGASVNLYLVDSRQHCLQLTEDPQVATGVVLAVATECANS